MPVNADDSELIDHAWLKSVGFSRGMQPAATNVLSIWSDTNYMTIEQSRDREYWSISVGDSDVSVYLPAGFVFSTRGDVRRLCDAFDLGLKE